MEKKSTPEETPKKKTPLDRFLDWCVGVVQWFKRFSTINEDDHFMMVAVKVVLRIIGILILIALSPFLIFSLLVAFLLAG